MSPRRRGFHRIGILLLVASFMWTATVAASRAAADRQCMLADECHHSFLVCGCCLSSPADQSLPAPLPQGVTTLAGLNVATVVVLPFLPSATAAGDLSAALHAHSPIHGYRSTSLSVLFSTYLI